MVAVVVTDNLVIKSEPGTGKESVGYKPWLQRGDQLYVLRGPVRASGYKWYEVMPLSDKYFPDWFYFSGWVAAASKKDKLWIKPLAGAPDCPDTPSTVAGLAPSRWPTPAMTRRCSTGSTTRKPTHRARSSSLTPSPIRARGSGAPSV
jgi:hypothetical protein